MEPSTFGLMSLMTLVEETALGRVGDRFNMLLLLLLMALLLLLLIWLLLLLLLLLLLSLLLCDARPDGGGP